MSPSGGEFGNHIDHLLSPVVKYIELKLLLLLYINFEMKVKLPQVLWLNLKEGLSSLNKYVYVLYQNPRPGNGSFY